MYWRKNCAHLKITCFELEGQEGRMKECSVVECVTSGTVETVVECVTSGTEETGDDAGALAFCL